MLDMYISGLGGDTKSNIVPEDAIGDMGDQMFHGELKDVQRDQDSS